VRRRWRRVTAEQAQHCTFELEAFLFFTFFLHSCVVVLPPVVLWSFHPRHKQTRSSR